MRIGILGSGLMGGKLGTLFVRAGHEVVFSYARSKEKLKRLSRNAGANALAARRPKPRRTRTRSSWPCTGRGSQMCCNRQAMFRARSSSTARCR